MTIPDEIECGSREMLPALGPPPQKIPRQEFECRQFAHTGVKYGHEKDLRIPSVFDLSVLEGKRLGILRVACSRSATMDTLRGNGSPEWDELGTDGSDLWVMVFEVHMRAVRPREEGSEPLEGAFLSHYLS